MINGRGDWRPMAEALGIDVFQRSKTVWIAAGRYQGRDFRVKGRSGHIALSLWKEAARWRGTEW